MKIYYPESVELILNTLNRAGFEAYIVGGCVRNCLLGIDVHDWDITTNAEPSEVCSCFSAYKLIPIGLKHGTVGVLINGIIYEITTFRTDGEYSDNRHPQKVAFTKSLEEDLKRRDFTVNALAYSKKTGLIDLFDGQNDLIKKTIRCVGDPDKRFNEDALRMMRALRFSAVLNFKIDSKTSESIIHNKELLRNISAERITSEFNGILCAVKPSDVLDNYKDIFYVFIPELAPMDGFEQHNPHHNKDVWRHTLCAVDNVNNSLTERLAMLFHDISKPLTFKQDENGTGHFYGHAALSETMSRNILKRMRYSNSIIDSVAGIIKHHESLRQISAAGIKRIINDIGIDNTDKLLNINLADIMAQSEYQHREKLNSCRLKREIFNRIIQDDECVSLSQLKLNGNQLKILGITDGKTIGSILKQVLNMVVENKLKNDGAELLNFVSENYLNH